MPTAARLVGAMSLGFACVIMAYVLIAYYPEERLERYDTELQWLFGLTGVVFGWFSLGKRASMQDTGTGIMLGVRATITVIVFLVFALAVNHVSANILAQDFVGARPMQAIFQMFFKTVDYFVLLANGEVLAIFFGTGITVGVLTRNAAKRWD